MPEIGRSVFVIPPQQYKANRPHVQILNDEAWSVVQECRGMHQDHVVVYRREREKNIDEKPVMRYDRIETMNNTGFQAARKAAGLTELRVHDLRHTFGQRLRRPVCRRKTARCCWDMRSKACRSTTRRQRLLACSPWPTR